MNSFLKSPTRRKQFLLLLVDTIIVFAVFVCAYSIRIVLFEGRSLATLGERLSWLIFVGVFIHLVTFYIFELYSITKKGPKDRLLLWITVSVVLGFGFIAVASYGFPQDKLGRVIGLIHVPLLIVVIYFWRRLFYALYSKRMPQNNLLILGSSSSTEVITGLLNNYPLMNYNLTGIISDYKENPGCIAINGKKCDTGINSYIAQHKIGTVVVAEKLKGAPALKKLFIDMKFKGIEILDFPTFYRRLTGKVPVRQVSDAWMLFSHQDKSFQPAIYLKLKRLVDVTISSVGLVVSGPLLLIIALAIKYSSKGPVFFRQERLGMNERPFTFLKFRTMVDEAEKETGPKWSSSDDPRITGVGRFLRKTRFDELPQLINVLKGDISMVGPRPIRKHFANRLAEKFPFYRIRFSVKPGITGWAQVNGDYAGSDEGQLEKLEYELFYIQNQSIFLDLFILLKTVQTVIFRPGE